MKKLVALLELFRKGNSVLEPELWKNRQITVTILAGVIVAIVNTLAAFGYSLPVDTETANVIAAGVIAVVNTVLTVTTTEKVGFGQSVKEQENNTSAKPKENNPYFNNDLFG